jgi:transposase
MSEDSTYVGMDVHRKTIAVSMLRPGSGKAIEWQVVHESAAVGRLIRKLRRERPVRCCYEAGPLGYTLKRQFDRSDLPCMVVAPSLIPVRHGDRIKTDRRDARKLSELLRADLLTEVQPPTESEEAVRDLCRCREDAQLDLARARHRLNKFLVRRGRFFNEGYAWSQRHRTWLHKLQFERDVDRAVFEDYLLVVEQGEARVAALDGQLEDVCQTEPYRDAVGALRCFRGIATVTAVAIVAELHDLRRFATAPRLMAYLGLVPSEYSSGGKRRLGGITRAGNRHVRRLLVETAWHYRHKPAVGVHLRKRRLGQSPEIIALADKAQRRLCRRYRRMVMRKKHHNTIVVAIARELVGYLWEALRTVTPARA